MKLLFFLFLLCSSVLADPKREITVWAMGAEGKMIREIADEYEKLHPDVRVKTQAVPWNGAHEKMVTAVVGNIPPDVCQMGTTWMTEFLAMKSLENLDPFFQKSQTVRTDDFFSGSLSTCKNGSSVYGIPWTVDTRVFYYRTDLLKKCGITSFPDTWDSLNDALVKIRDWKKRENLTGYSISLPVNDWQMFLPFLWQNDGDILAKDNPGNCLIAENEAVEAMRFYKGFFDQELSPKEAAKDLNLFNAFETGYYPMFISGPWMVSEVQKNKPQLEGLWKTAPMARGKNRTSFIGGCNLVIFKMSRNKADAWDFIEYLSQPQIQARWYQISRNLPSVEKAWDYPEISGNPLLSAFREQLSFCKSPPDVKQWEMIALVISQCLEKVIYGKTAESDGLKNAAAEINAMMNTAQKKQSVAFRLLMLSLILILLISGPVYYLYTGLDSGDFRVLKTSLLFVLPALSVLFVFLIIPLFSSFIMSMTDWDISAMNDYSKLSFTGFSNYIKLMKDPVFWISLRNTLTFSLIGVPLGITVSLLCAVLLNQQVLKLKGFFRTGLFLPVISTLVAVAVVWRWLYNQEYGVFNWLLSAGGLSPVKWLSDPHVALFSLIIMAVWKGFGYNMIIFLAALQGIPRELYEAADIDGASALQQFFRITLPMLSRTVLFVTVMTTTGYLQFFTEPYVMTEGGPLNSTMSVVLYMYQHGFKFYNLGYASSVAYALCGLICIFTLLQFRVFRNAGQ